jgi:hypothetical protein
MGRVQTSTGLRISTADHELFVRATCPLHPSMNISDHTASDNDSLSSPARPEMAHTSSSTSHVSGLSSHSQLHSMSAQSASSMTMAPDQRPSLSENRRVSSGIGGGASSFGHGNYRDKEDAVPVGFDEGILRGLCEMDVSPLFVHRKVRYGC